MRQGPHHAAQKSARTGTLDSRTISSNSAVLTLRGSSAGGRAAWHFPHLPVSERCFAGTRFFVPQDLQVRIIRAAVRFRTRFCKAFLVVVDANRSAQASLNGACGHRKREQPIADLLPIHNATLHDKAYACDRADVLGRIAGHGDDVGKVAGLELANLPLPSQQFGAVQHICL